MKGREGNRGRTTTESQHLWNKEDSPVGVKTGIGATND